MEFGKAFSYPFEDTDWVKKLLIGALIMLIPLVGGILVAGWGIEITRRLIRREPVLLPDWSNFGGHLVNGLKVVVIGLVYALPIILLQACSQGATFAVQDGSDQTVNTVITVVMVCFGCITFIYAILLALVLPAAMGNFAATDQLGAAFRFGEVIGLVRAAPGAYVFVLLGGICAGIIAMLGSIACGIGVLFTAVYANAINAHLQGQAYNQAMAAKGTPATPAY